MFGAIKLFLLTILFFIVIKFPFIAQGKKSKLILKIIKAGGVAFVKMGQSLAVRPDIVGQVYADELKNLQDNMESFPYSKFKTILQKNLNKPINKVFKSIDENPVGCASIAQVHKGVLSNGDNVAIKILRPNIRKVFFRDIKLFYKLALMIEFFNPKLKRLNLFAVVEHMHQWVKSELSLKKESENAKKLSDNFAVVDEYQGDFFKVPQVYEKLSTEDVMVIEWIDGIRIDDVKSYKKLKINQQDILKKSATVFFLQVFRDGFFHADMHPGNMFVDNKGNLYPIDFGIMGRVDKKTRIYIADVLYYLMKQDYKALAQVHFNAGYVPSTYGINEFASALEKIDKGVRKKGKLSNISMGELLSKLFETTEKFQMKTRPELLLLKKTIIVAEGVGRIISPKSNMWNLISDLIEQWYKVNRGMSGRFEYMLSDIINQESETIKPLMEKSTVVKSICVDIAIIVGITSVFYVI